MWNPISLANCLRNSSCWSRDEWSPVTQLPHSLLLISQSWQCPWALTTSCTKKQQTYQLFLCTGSSGKQFNINKTAKPIIQANLFFTTNNIQAHQKSVLKTPLNVYLPVSKLKTFLQHINEPIFVTVVGMPHTYITGKSNLSRWN